MARKLNARAIDLDRVRPLRWAWRDRLLVGYINLLVGDEGVGKGTFLAWLVAQLTNGTLPGDLRGQPVRVLIVGDEDGFDSVIVPRLHAAGARLDQVLDLPVDDEGPLDVHRDATAFRELVRAEDIRVVVFDQFLDNLGVGTDDYKAKAVRDAVAPLRRAVADLDLVALAALHTNKSGVGTFRQRVAGTQAFNALSRSSLLVAEHPEDPDMRILARGKGNYAARPPVIEFAIDGKTFTLNGHEHTVPCATGVSESDITLDDVLREPDRTPSKADRGRQLILDALADGEWHDAGPIRDMLIEEGLSKRGADRAADDLGVERRDTDTFPRRRQWRRLAREDANGAIGVTGAIADDSRASRANRVSDDNVTQATPEEQDAYDRALRLVDGGVA